MKRRFRDAQCEYESEMRNRLMRRLWRHVHPDLFARWPVAQAANQRAIQDLNALVEAAESDPASHSTLPRKRQDFSFFVRDEENPEELREVSASWNPPSYISMARLPSATQADSWKRSTEGCIASLLRAIDPAEVPPPVAGAFSSATDSPQGGVRDATPADEKMVRAAAAAAERQRQQGQPDPSAPTRRPRAGGRLRRAMLFFHDVPEDMRGRAAAHLASLIDEVLPAGSAHGPILLCGSEPPLDAVASGFACIFLDADADALRRSLQGAAGSAAAAAAADQRSRVVQLSAASKQLRVRLGCEVVQTAEDLRADEGLRMYESLLYQAASLRAALDVPWDGLHVRLHGAVAGEEERRGRGAEGVRAPPLRVVDGTCGGCTVEIRGEIGADEALGFVKGEWRALRHCQERHALAEELRERLGCAGVECVGAPSTTVEQCDALHRLLRVLRHEPLFLPGGSEDLASIILLVGHEGEGVATSRAARLSNGAQATELRLPNTFDEHATIALLMELSARGAGSASRGAGHRHGHRRQPEPRRHDKRPARRGGGRRR
jgi:hypothetical protein